MKPIYKCNLYAIKQPITVYRDYFKTENISASQIELVKEIFVQPFFGKYREIITHMSFPLYIRNIRYGEYYTKIKKFLFLLIEIDQGNSLGCHDWKEKLDWRYDEIFELELKLRLAKSNELEQYIVHNRDTLKEELYTLKSNLEQSYRDSYKQNRCSPEYLVKKAEQERQLSLLKSLRK